jgi:hypothetical protein
MGQEASTDPKTNPFDSGLSNELLDDLVPPTGRQPANPLRQSPAAGEDLGTANRVNPIEVIGGQMLKVAGFLRSERIDDQTHARQQEIVSLLSQLIDQVDDSSASQSQAAMQQQQRRKQEESTAQQGGQDQADAGEEVQAAAAPETNNSDDQDTLVRESIKTVWGQLPSRVREQIQSPLREEFLPSYRQLIEEYYKQLSKKQMR